MTTETTVTDTSEDLFNVKYWNQRWVENRIGWHKTTVNPNLLKYIEQLTGQKLSEEPLTDQEQFQKNSKKTWFVPLCGKTLDIPYLLSQGFRVFGVEAVKMPIEELNAEHKLEMVYNEDTKLFTGMNGRVQIYVGDLFTCPVETFGPFDYVWDRGAFIAVEYPHRKDYSATMQRALKNADGSWFDFSYLLDSLLYDKTKFEGPPRSTSDDDMEEYFGSWANFRLLSAEGIAEGSAVYKALNGDALGRTFHITPKL